MHNEYDDAPNRFPDESPVLVWYPLAGADERDRNAWAWLTGTVIGRAVFD